MAEERPETLYNDEYRRAQDEDHEAKASDQRCFPALSFYAEGFKRGSREYQSDCDERGRHGRRAREALAEFDTPKEDHEARYHAAVREAFVMGVSTEPWRIKRIVDAYLSRVSPEEPPTHNPYAVGAMRAARRALNGEGDRDRALRLLDDALGRLSRVSPSPEPCRHEWSEFNEPYCTRCGAHRDDVSPSPEGKTVETVLGPLKVLPECEAQAVCVNGSKCWEAGRCLRARSPQGEDHEAATEAERNYEMREHDPSAPDPPSPSEVREMRLVEALREVRQWCVDGKDAIEPRNVLGQVVAAVDRALAEFDTPKEDR